MTSLTLQSLLLLFFYISLFYPSFWITLISNFVIINCEMFVVWMHGWMKMNYVDCNLSDLRWNKLRTSFKGWCVHAYFSPILTGPSNSLFSGLFPCEINIQLVSWEVDYLHVHSSSQFALTSLYLLSWIFKNNSI